MRRFKIRLCAFDERFTPVHSRTEWNVFWKLLEAYPNNKRLKNLERLAQNSLIDLFQKKDMYIYSESQDSLILKDTHLEIYALGPAYGLLATINACKMMGVTKVTIYHYNWKTESFYKQDIV
jgi:hypothetical protein